MVGLGDVSRHFCRTVPKPFPSCVGRLWHGFHDAVRSHLRAASLFSDPPRCVAVRIAAQAKRRVRRALRRPSRSPAMGDMFAQPVAARLRGGIGAEYGSGSIASNMRRDESLDIRAAITNAAADSDVWDATSISTFAVEGAQAAAQISGCFSRRKQSLALIDVHDGVACQRQTKSGVARQCMTRLVRSKCSNQSGLSL